MNIKTCWGTCVLCGNMKKNFLIARPLGPLWHLSHRILTSSPAAVVFVLALLEMTLMCSGERRQPLCLSLTNSALQSPHVHMQCHHGASFLRLQRFLRRQKLSAANPSDIREYFASVGYFSTDLMQDQDFTLEVLAPQHSDNIVYCIKANKNVLRIKLCMNCTGQTIGHN